MDDLIAFLRARLDDLEDAAKWAPGPDWWQEDKPFVWGEDSDSEVSCSKGRVAVVDHQAATAVAHIVLNDPARVLRRVKVGRRVIDEFERCGPHTQGHPGLRFAVQALALEYADHDDYREEWQP